jgi:hypothetical protein
MSDDEKKEESKSESAPSEPENLVSTHVEVAVDALTSGFGVASEPGK